MINRLNKEPLTSQTELFFRCESIEGKTFSQLAKFLGLTIPQDPLKRKGWVGKAIELALGATAGNKSSPDFCGLGIELKTLPINHLGTPSESTFITTIPLLTLQQQTWLTSQCYSKLKHVLWVPIEGDQRIDFFDRRIGRSILWSPSDSEMAVLENDWQEFALLISTGRLAEINASLGDFLQVRPKGANSRSLCYGFDEQGNRIATMPRGFYLRSTFTETIYLASLSLAELPTESG